MRTYDILLAGPRNRFMANGRIVSNSGRDVQLQNLPSPVTTDLGKYLDVAVKMIEEQDADGIRKKFGSIINTVTSVIRACFQSPEREILDVCDLNAIENRVLGWLSGCSAILEVFEKGLDPYLAFACRMYGIEYTPLQTAYKSGDKEAKNKRQVAKPAVLGCGYGLGPGVMKLPSGQYVAIIKKDQWGNDVKCGLLGYAENMGVQLTPEQAYLAHQAFRQAYPEVVDFWGEMDRGVKEVLKNGGKVWVGQKDGRPGVCFDRKKRPNGQYILRMLLPSGRYLHYINARLEEHERVNQQTGQVVIDPKTNQPKMDLQIFYDGIGHGVGAVTKGMKWGATSTYGGKLTENAVQAISRDLLLHAMLLAEERGIILVGHCHDELISVRENVPWIAGLDVLAECMSTTPRWAPNLPLKADGFSSLYYKKG